MFTHTLYTRNLIQYLLILCLYTNKIFKYSFCFISMKYCKTEIFVIRN